MLKYFGNCKWSTWASVCMYVCLVWCWSGLILVINGNGAWTFRKFSLNRTHSISWPHSPQNDHFANLQSSTTTAEPKRKKKMNERNKSMNSWTIICTSSNHFCYFVFLSFFYYYYHCIVEDCCWCTCPMLVQSTNFKMRNELGAIAMTTTMTTTTLGIPTWKTSVAPYHTRKAFKRTEFE